MSMELTRLPKSSGSSETKLDTVGYAPIDEGPIIRILEMPGLDPAMLGALVDDVADDAYERHHGEVLAKIATAPEIDAEFRDARRDLRMASWRRFLTTRHIRVKAPRAASAAAANTRRNGGLRLPDAEKAFIAFAMVFLLVSLIFLLYTGSQLILTERIYPAVKILLQAVLVTGAIQLGFLMVPLTFAKSITTSRVLLAFRLIVNAGAILCATLFLYWLWEHGDVSAARSFSARSGLADLGDLANFTLNLSHIESKARVISILGEAFGAIAVKLNVDYLRGAHLRWKLIPNPERTALDDEIAKQRDRVKECRKEQARLALLAIGYERGMFLNRACTHGFVESMCRDWDAKLHQEQRDLRQQGLRRARWPR